MILEQIRLGPLQANCYILGDSKTRRAMIIDPGDEYEKIARLLDDKDLKASFVVNTHGHIDHIKAENELGLTVYAYRDEVAMLREAKLNLSEFLLTPFSVTAKVEPLDDNQDIVLDSIRLRVIHTPGHTPGGISLLVLQPVNKIVFTGDTLFFGSVGRTDFPGASEKALIRSIKDRLLVLDDDTVVYPGHGPQTTIGVEKKNNPFLG